MSVEALREIVSRLSPSAHSLAAVAAALHARASGEPLHPEIQPHVDQVLRALGARDAFDALAEHDAAPLLGELQTFAFSNLQLFFPTSPRTGATGLELDAMLAAGQVSSAFPLHLARAIAPRLEGLVERLARAGATFLDVGVGVAALSIEMARRWPSLSIVGVDRSAPALGLAREAVRAAELDSRIELREQAAEDLPDRDAFDLAWIPGAFIAEQAIDAILDRVHRALRPGGWVLFVVLRAPSDPLAESLARLRAALLGGFVTTSEIMEQRMRARGFVDVATLPGAATALTAMIAGRRAPPGSPNAAQFVK